MALSSLFTISTSSLFAHQKALAVTASNIANANNPAYTRQVVMFGTAPPDHRAYFSFGSGVNVDKVLRVRNNVTDTQIRNNNQKYYDAEKQSTVLKQVETLFSEPSEYGLSNLMTSFFNSWDELAVDPHSTALRTTVAQSAQNLSEKISSIYKGITQTKLDTKNEAIDTVNKINTIVEQLHTVNSQVYEAHVVGSFDNDLIDKRDALLDELSQYANINVSIDENEVANVSIGGVFAVDGLHHVKFELKQKDEKLILQTNGEEIKTNLQGGSLNALFGLYNNQLPEQIKKLDEISTTIMENVNAIHSKGYSITDPPQTGIDFFTGYEDGVLEINQDILDDPFNIAISSNGTDGNNEVALKIAALKGEKILNDRTLTDNYSDFISGVANKIRLEDQNQESYGLVLHQLNQQKAEYSGVSTDEEMVNIVEYQKSYDAAAKLIKVADDLLQTLINMV